MAVDAPAQPMLAVKQFIPPVRSGAVARDVLAGRMTSARTRLTLVVAPAGWGKTSLLSSCARELCADQRVAWVSLDDSDDEPRRFWRYVLSALGDASDEISSASLEALEVGDKAILDLALPLLLNELARSTADHVLVLDDYHTVTDRRIHEAMEFLLAYVPPSLSASTRRCHWRGSGHAATSPNCVRPICDSHPPRRRTSSPQCLVFSSTLR
jgi:ATP/maltotriose-dependent transcriptional regulator MalT